MLAWSTSCNLTRVSAPRISMARRSMLACQALLWLCRGCQLEYHTDFAATGCSVCLVRLDSLLQAQDRCNAAISEATCDAAGADLMRRSIASSLNGIDWAQLRANVRTQQRSTDSTGLGGVDWLWLVPGLVGLVALAAHRWQCIACDASCHFCSPLHKHGLFALRSAGMPACVKIDNHMVHHRSVVVG